MSETPALDSLGYANQQPARAVPKGQPLVVTKLERQRAAQAAERACREAVDKRDGRKCFFPGRPHPASDKHHIVPSSVRGKRIWITSDILSACAEHHRWFKAGLIRVEGNPDKGPVSVLLTKLGEEAGIRIPKRKATP
jgi:hypothetical protein